MTVRVRSPDVRGWIVLELLDDFRPSNDEEYQHRDAMYELLATTTAPFDRRQYDPGHFTASAFVVSPATDRVLLVDHPTLALWLQPGGHIDPDDVSPAAGAAREVVEETGLPVPRPHLLFDIDVHAIPARAAAPEHQHFDLRFLIELGDAPVPVSPEGVRAEWLAWDDVTHRVTDASVLRMVRKWHERRGGRA